MTNEEALEAVAEMIKTGGSFVKSLAEAYCHADHVNSRILREAFPKYFQEYFERGRERYGVKVEKKLSEKQKKCLAVLVEPFRIRSERTIFFFRGIARRAGMEEREARIATRALARKGFAEMETAWDDCDGGIAGRGYQATEAGVEFFLKRKLF